MFQTHSKNRFSSTAVGFAGLFTVVLVGACGGGNATGGDAAKQTTPALADCPVPTDSIIGHSLDKFISTRDPQPYRFLIAMSGDEAIPAAAQWPLNSLNRIPYGWPSDPALQEKQISDMRIKTPLPMIALFYHGHSRLPDGRYQTEFSGEYHDFKNSGKKIARTAVFFDCTAPAGSRYRAADEVAKTDTTTGKSLN